MSTRFRSVLAFAVFAPLVVLGCSHVTARAVAVATAPVDAGAVEPAPTPAPREPDLVCAHGELVPPLTSPGATTSCDPQAADLQALELALACAPQTSVTPLARTPWDRATAPANLDLVERRFGLTQEERAHLMKDGFVVPARLAYPSYAPALHDVYRSQLPVYISADAVMHAIYRSNDTFIATLEYDELAPRLERSLEAMHEALRATPARYPSEVARDVDLYLTVARTLLAGAKVPSVLGADVDREADALVALAQSANGMPVMNLFGRDRLVDFAQFKPRGHYSSESAATNPYNADLSRYFQGAMWLSRIELNIVSRSSRSSSPELDPAETPREERVAMALAELARDSSALKEIAEVDQAWALLAGNREDVSPMALLSLMDAAKIVDVASADAPDKLRAQIGAGFVRSARTHYQAEGSPNLPVIATLLGPRITSDAAATRPLVHPEVPDRHEVPMTDIAYALGHDRALAYTAAGDATLRAGLDKARAITRKPGTGPDLYTGWLGAINALADKPVGTVPSFMETDAFADLRMDSAIAAYGQLRHNNILMVPVTYDEPGCEIPDGFVEPAPAVYGALIAYADRGAKVTAALSPSNEEYFLRLGRVLRVLEEISEHELANQPLTADEQRFLSMVTEISYGRRGGYSSGPAGSGWYFEMFRSPEDGLTDASFIADYFASPYEGTAFYAGVSEVRMGLFVVDTGGAPRVLAGPVARAFEAVAPFAARYTDSDVARAPARDPWAASYTANQVAEPPLVLSVKTKADKREGYSGDITFTATSAADLPLVTLEITDHHHVPIATLTHAVKKGQIVRFAFQSRKIADGDVAAFGAEGVHLRIGEFHFFDHGSFSASEYAPVDLSARRWTFGPMKPPTAKREAKAQKKV